MEFTINRGLKFRIYPTEEQKVKIIKNLGCKRFVFNYFLNLRKTEYKANKRTFSYKEMSSILTDLKKYPEYQWLNKADSISLQQTLKDLIKAYDNFFKKIQNATVIRTASGKFFVTLCVKQTISVKQNKGNEIGIDVGIKHFYSDTNGNTVENPKLCKRFAVKLAREQRRLSRKMKNSKQREKQRIRVARVHERIVNIREDFQHKLALHLAQENQFIAVEKLNIRGMVKNRKLAKAISDVAWGRFFQKLEYKVREYGGELVKIPTFYPSSQTCSVCGYKNPIVKNLNIREWECPKCHNHHDRDFNASINILNKAKSA